MTTRNISALLEALPLPALLINGGSLIAASNRGARDLFGDTLDGRLFVSVLRHPDALASIDAARSDGTAAQREITLAVPVRTTYRISASPVELDGARQVLFTLQDISLLIEAEQMRSDFVANVSHELRSPLATLTGVIETLEGAARDDPEARERFLGIMREEADRMTRLIGDLLSLSRIEVSEHVRPSNRIDIAALVERVAANARLGTDARNMSVRVQTDGIVPPVLGDDDELVEVFGNLVDNALKYSHDGSEVTISLGAQPAGRGLRVPSVAVDVRDRGEGIPQDEIPRLTERFYRVDKARSRKLGGTGLGLAIVKHIVKRHRGKLAIASRPGEGSCFTVILPQAGT